MPPATKTGGSRATEGSAEPGAVPRRPSLGEILLFAQACRLFLSTRRLSRGAPIARLADRLLAKHLLPRGVRPEAARLATARAARRLGWVPGLLTTCLPRSLVTGTLLADREDVELVIGVRRGAESHHPLDGHAWLTVASEPLEVLPGDDPHDPRGEPYTEILRRPLRRG